MDKSCANHPESMALATCKACDKSICLMCVVDEKEGTFCSSECHAAFVEGREVPKFVEAATVGSGGSQKIESIFDDAPSPSSESEGMNLPPASGDDRMPIVSEGTKWRSIGTQCQNHSDTPAARSSRTSPVGGGTAERAALQGKPVFKFKPPPKSNKTPLLAAIALFAVILAVGGYYGWKVFSPEAPIAPDPVADNPDLHPKPPDPNVEVNPPVVVPPVVNPPVVVPPVVNPPVVVDNTPTRPWVKPVPKPKAVPIKTVNPWADETPGSWYRLKTVAGSKTTYTDIGLKEKSASSYTLATQTSADGQASAVSEKKIDAPVVYLRGEKTFSFDGQTFLCEVRTDTLDEGAPKTYALLSGKYHGAVLQVEGGADGGYTTTKVWEYTARVKNRSLDCLVVEGKTGGKMVKSYYTTLPIQTLRQDKDGASTTLVDLGSDWSKRPEFPK